MEQYDIVSKVNDLKRSSSVSSIIATYLLTLSADEVSHLRIVDIEKNCHVSPPSVMRDFVKNVAFIPFHSSSLRSPISCTMKERSSNQMWNSMSSQSITVPSLRIPFEEQHPYYRKKS